MLLPVKFFFVREYKFPFFFKRNLILVPLMSGILFWAELVYAIDPSQLWLPRNYNRYMNELKQAVEVAEKTERCHNAVAGTVSTRDSVKEHPVFKITCRDENRKTFPWLVDGKTMEILNAPKPKDNKKNSRSADRKALDGLSGEERSIALRKQTVWSVCKYRILRKVRHLTDISLEQIETPEPERIEGNGLFYKTEFYGMPKTAVKKDEIENYITTCRYQNREYHIDLTLLDPTSSDEVINSEIAESRSNKVQSNQTEDIVDKTTIKPMFSDTQEGLAKNELEDSSLKESSLKESDLEKSLAETNMQKESEDPCLAALQKKTAALDNVVWHVEDKNPVNLSIDETRTIAFTAKGPSGNPIHALGVCQVSNATLSVEIQKNKKASM